MAILFRSTPAATARWRPLLARLMPDVETTLPPKAAAQIGGEPHRMPGAPAASWEPCSRRIE